MIKIHRFFLTLCFAVLLPCSGFSEVPVVDESENYAMLDDHQAEFDRPDAPLERDYAFNDMAPLAVEEPEFNAELIDETPIAKATAPSADDLPMAYDDYETSSTQKNALLLDKVQHLQQEVQELRGQLEVQAHDLKLLQQQQLAFYKDLDARLSNNSSISGKQNQPMTLQEPIKTEALKPSSSSTTATLAPLNAAAKTNPANEQISYLAAYELVKNKKYDDALSAMKTFVNQYPQSGYKPNAEYWLGELYLVKKNYPEAIQHFDAVLQHYPSSSKAAASLLKSGYALAASGKKEEARQRLRDVIKNYPDTNTAQLATAKLNALGT
ncbi:tol-pal system protein YbgF [Legionella yabuuchiae]|uniref:tol-pal system protein YbgF n=1 Tax=Legionella yabuuchiae TaxID=376727 RepID=UPI001054C7B3|nr:tol-pal system protein YbgF [Legionella yabuuchiae]